MPLILPQEYIHTLESYLDITDLSGLGVRRYAEAVGRISHGLTKEHESYVTSRYLKDEETRKAYLLYYSTINLLKIWPPLRELSRSGFFAGKGTLRHLDLGSGPGTATWGLATYLKEEQPSIAQLVTRSTDALKENLRLVEQFARLFSKQISPLEVRLTTAPLDLSNLNANEADSSIHDLITMMNVLAELDDEHDAAIIELLSNKLTEAGAIVMIEPSRKSESRRALRFRDRMAAAGFNVYAPCCKTGSCPALEDEGNWCHTEIDWQRPDFIREIDDRVGTLRLSLKSTYVVFLKRDFNVSDTFRAGRDFAKTGRVVSELFKEKGRARMFICNERGRREYVLNKRDKSPTNSDVLKTARYDLVQIEGVEEREHDVKIGGEAVFHTLISAEGCENVDKLD